MLSMNEDKIDRICKEVLETVKRKEDQRLMELHDKIPMKVTVTKCNIYNRKVISFTVFKMILLILAIAITTFIATVCINNVLVSFFKTINSIGF